ncbi:MAG: PP0621 family protein [Candidatus Thiodiazotropha sp.]
MGLRYILFGLALWGIYLIVRHFQRTRSLRKPPSSNRMKSVDSVQCAYCGLHLPRQEALEQKGRYYCNQAHLSAARKDSS